MGILVCLTPPPSNLGPIIMVGLNRCSSLWQVLSVDCIVEEFAKYTDCDSRFIQVSVRNFMHFVNRTFTLSSHSKLHHTQYQGCMNIQYKTGDDPIR